MTVKKTGAFPVFLTVMVLFLPSFGGKLSNFHAGQKNLFLSARFGNLIALILLFRVGRDLETQFLPLLYINNTVRSYGVGRLGSE